MLQFLVLTALFLLAGGERIVRFISSDGNIYFGDAILPTNTTDAFFSTRAKVIQGDILGNFTVTREIKDIKKLLAPLPSDRVRTVRMVGLNYVSHIDESNMTIPQWPILFYKPWTALNTPSDPIPVSAGFQTQGNFTSSMDWEGELVVVIKKAAYNITDDEALDHVLGYTVGHDVSHRGWQIERGGEPQPQYSMGKGADGWAPWGPAIVTTDIIPDPQVLNLHTKVNGVTQQNATTADMIFGVKHLISFFSMGTTLLPGDVIFTGTPSGTNLGKVVPEYLVNGDVVEVGLENVGTCTNAIRYVDTSSDSVNSFFRL
ncbi:related to bifunctional 4-hydroxyphenylacetate degradation enzyme [Armillaria ostoyae]|uniref:Related to bifunctional 4-hydroxyphenylacetate degradation enzyme n=1 Tax=Armillaria ostoyae TaxID=47428 RepID=A0A284RAS9_ARMOS|nr:related to bifunctional 4-hydroxyphenylacetate degradation enzyme [Armillaria ostoyae]